MIHDEFISRLTYEAACNRVFSKKHIAKIKYFSACTGESFSQTLKYIIDNSELIYLLSLKK